MADAPDDAAQVARSLMAEGTLKRLQDYLVRGRRYEHTDEQKLSRIWVSGAQAWGNDPYQPATEMDDSAAEYGMRGLMPPYELATDAIENATSKIKARHDAMTESELAEANELMLAEHEKNTRSRN